MKKISDEQIDSIEKALVQANIPVQMFIGIQNLFKSLPVVEDKKVLKDAEALIVAAEGE